MKDKFNKKYIIITKDLQKNLIEFLDEIQFDAASSDDKDSMHKVNFVNWAINELLSGYEAYFPKKKSREDYVDEHLWIGIYPRCPMRIITNLLTKLITF